jgi:hypothetical protein
MKIKLLLSVVVVVVVVVVIIIIRDSSVGIALGYGLDNRGSRFDSRWGLGIFLFPTASRTALGPRGSSLGVKRPGREADHSPPSSVAVKE